MKKLMKLTVFVLICGLTVGCTSVNISSLNNTEQDVMVKVINLDKADTEPSELDTQVKNGKVETLGSYSIGTKLKTILYLKNGGMLAQSINTVNWKPDPLLIELTAPKIEIPKFTPQDPAILLERILGDLGDTPNSSREDANIAGYLGGIYTKENSVFVRQIAPDRLNAALQAANIKLKVNTLPNKTEKSTFQDSTQNDSKSYANLELHLPQVLKGELKADFSKSKVYRHVINIENMGFVPSLVAANDLTSYLGRSDIGKEIIQNLKSLIATYGKVYYLDSIYLVDHMDIKTFRSEEIKIDTDIHTANFFDANGAFAWQEANDQNSQLASLILGAKYIPLDLSDNQKLITEKAILTQEAPAPISLPPTIPIVPNP